MAAIIQKTQVNEIPVDDLTRLRDEYTDALKGGDMAKVRSIGPQLTALERLNTSAVTRERNAKQRGKQADIFSGGAKWELLRQCFEDAPTETGPEQSVLVHIAWHVNRKSGRAWPSTARLAAMTKFGRRTVCRAIDGLVDKRVLVRRSGKNKGSRNNYMINATWPTQNEIELA